MLHTVGYKNGFYMYVKYLSIIRSNRYRQWVSVVVSW